MKLIKCVINYLIVFIYLIFNNVYSQNQFELDSLLIISHYKEVEKFCYTDIDSSYYYLDLIDEITFRQKLWDDRVYVSLWKVACARFWENLDSMDTYLFQAENRLEKHKNQLSPSFWDQQWYDLQMRIADFESKNGRLDDSSKRFHTIINALIEKDSLTYELYQTLILSYEHLGAIHTRKKNYSSAIECYQYCIDYEMEMAQKEGRNPIYETSYARLASVYLRMKEYRLSKENYLFAISYYNEIFKDRPSEIVKLQNHVNPIFIGISQAYYNLEQIDSARIYAEKSINFPSINDNQKARSFLWLADLSSNQGDLAAATGYYNEAIKYFNAVYKNAKHFEIGRANMHQGDFYSKYKMWENAKISYQKALINIVENFNDENFDINPDLNEVYSKRDLLGCLINKANLQYEIEQIRKNNFSASNNSSWKTCQLGLQLIDSVRLENIPEYDKQGLIEGSYSLYALICENAFNSKNNWTEDAFKAVEKSRAILLAEAYQKSKLISSLTNANEQIEEEIKLKEQISHLKGKLYNLRNKGQKTKEQELKNRIFEFRQKLNRTQQNNETEYYENINNIRPLPSQLISESVLSNNQSLLQYFIHDTTAFLFLLSPTLKNIEIKKLEWNQAWTDMANTIKEDIFYQNDTAYLRKARALYDRLLKPALDTIDTDRLIIVPDGELWNVPFDALLTNDNFDPKNFQFKDLPYLGRKKSISYAFSATLLHDMTKRKRKNKRNAFMAFAPSYRDTGDILTGEYALKNALNPLVFSIPESDSIVQAIGGRLWADTSASKFNFLEHAGRADILHISGHAKANVDEPNFSYIAFSNMVDNSFKLYVHELYNHPMPASMVVMSACETGTGPVWKGEGSISIARAFAYSGTQSIVTTLWSVEERSAMDISVAFYKYLKKGMPKDEVLQRVKKEYINHSLDDDRAHPRYWAAFTVVGSVEPLFMPVWQKCLIGFLVLTAVSWMLWFYFKKKRNNNGNTDNADNTDFHG